MYEGARVLDVLDLWRTGRLAVKIASPQIRASISVALPGPTNHYLELLTVPAILSVRTKETEHKIFINIKHWSKTFFSF